MYKKIDILVCNKSSNYLEGYTDYTYLCSTNQSRTLEQALSKLAGKTLRSCCNGVSYTFDSTIFTKQNKYGKIGFSGDYKILAIFTDKIYNYKD